MVIEEMRKVKELKIAEGVLRKAYKRTKIEGFREEEFQELERFIKLKVVEIDNENNVILTDTGKRVKEYVEVLLRREYLWNIAFAYGIDRCSWGYTISIPTDPSKIGALYDRNFTKEGSDKYIKHLCGEGSVDKIDITELGSVSIAFRGTLEMLGIRMNKVYRCGGTEEVLKKECAVKFPITERQLLDRGIQEGISQGYYIPVEFPGRANVTLVVKRDRKIKGVREFYRFLKERKLKIKTEPSDERISALKKFKSLGIECDDSGASFDDLLSGTPVIVLNTIPACFPEKFIVLEVPREEPKNYAILDARKCDKRVLNSVRNVCKMYDLIKGRAKFNFNIFSKMAILINEPFIKEIEDFRRLSMS